MNHKRLIGGVVLLLVLLGAGVAPACSYFQKSSAIIADAADSYCEATTPVARELARAQLHDEMVAEGLEMCLGCAGDAVSTCIGEHRPKQDWPPE